MLDRPDLEAGDQRQRLFDLTSTLVELRPGPCQRLLDAGATSTGPLVPVLPLLLAGAVSDGHGSSRDVLAWWQWVTTRG
jgi:hypothetical protein